MVKITVSEHRNPVLQQVDLGEKATLTTWGTIQVNKAHFFPSSFQLKKGNTVIYIDPIEVDTDEQADYILLTHAHPDHFSLSDINKLSNNNTHIICAKGVAKKLKGFENLQIVEPGETINLQALTVEAIAAYNTRSVFLWIKAHPKSKKNVGYVLRFNDGLSVYHAGDTDYIPEIKQIKDITAALVPIGGDNLTMDEEEAAKITNEIAPEFAIPMHYEIKNREELERFKQLVNPKTKVLELE